MIMRKIVPIFVSVLLSCMLVLTGACRTSDTSAKNPATLRPGSEETPVWFWSAGDGAQMDIKVYFDDRVIYEASFVIRLAQRTSTGDEVRESSLHFSFVAPRSIVWQGYKDTDETTVSGQTLLGDVWHAGAEPECLILGISFHGSDSIYMNTLHIALPDQRSESVVAPGLRIVTAPRARPFTR